MASTICEKYLIANSINTIMSIPSICYGWFGMPKKAPTLDTGDLQFSASCIVLIHGRNASPPQFTKLLASIKAAVPLSNIVAVNLPEGDASVDDDVQSIVEQVDAALEPVASSFKTIQLTLVGISKGGLTAARFAATNVLPKYIITKVITIASPLYGAIPANFAFWTKNTGKELSQNSELTVNTAESMESLVAADKLKVFNVVLRYDGIIVPSSSASYHFATDVHTQMSRTSHQFIQDHQEVIAKVTHWIALP